MTVMYYQPRAFLQLHMLCLCESLFNVGGVVIELIFVINLFIILIFH